jgi:hypothetical protein
MKKKIAKIGEGVRKLSMIRRASKSGFVRRRPSARTHARDDGHAQRHQSAVVATDVGGVGVGAVGRASDCRAGGGQVRFRGRTFIFFPFKVCDESEISQTHRQSLAAAAVRRFEYSA